MTRSQRALWRSMAGQSFAPADWFLRDKDVVKEEKTMWVYRQEDGSGKWLVGYYTPQGVWVQDSEHDMQEEAAGRVHWLNGGE